MMSRVLRSRVSEIQRVRDPRGPDSEGPRIRGSQIPGVGIPGGSRSGGPQPIASMRSGTGYPVDGPKGRRGRYTGHGTSSEALSYLVTSVVGSLTGLGYPRSQGSRFRGSQIPGVQIPRVQILGVPESEGLDLGVGVRNIPDLGSPDIYTNGPLDLVSGVPCAREGPRPLQKGSQMGSFAQQNHA